MSDDLDESRGLEMSPEGDGIEPLPDPTSDDENKRSAEVSRRRRIPHLRLETGISRAEQARIGALDQREPTYRRLPTHNDEAYGETGGTHQFDGPPETDD